MVRWGLMGLRSRGAAWGFFWLCIIIAAGCVAYGFFNPVFFTGAILVLPALWYYLAIRWVDEHSQWG